MPEMEPNPVFEIPDLLRAVAEEQKLRDQAMIEA